MGGLTIETKAVRDAIAACPEMEGETVRVGRHVIVPPCIPEPILVAFKAREGRPCPRVALKPENAEAQQLVSILIRKETRGLAPKWIKQNVDPLGDEASTRIVNRAIVAVHSEKVSRLLYPSSPEKQEAN